MSSTSGRFKISLRKASSLVFHQLRRLIVTCTRPDEPTLGVRDGAIESVPVGLTDDEHINVLRRGASLPGEARRP